MKITYPRSRLLAIPILFLCLSASAPAQTPRIDPAGIQGSVLLCGAGEISEAAIDRFLDLAGGADAKIAVVAIDDENTGVLMKRLTASAAKKEAVEPKLVQLKDIKLALAKMTGVWLLWKPGDTDLHKYPLKSELHALRKRSGVIAVSGEHTEIVEAYRLDLLPGGVIDARPTHLKTERTGLVGYDVAPKAALLLKGRTFSAVGEGKTDIHLPTSTTLPMRTITVQGKVQADLTALLRAALDRVEGFPPKKVETPVVPKGTLVIVGGGGSPAGMYKQFIEYAGGPEKATIVIFPTANPDPLPKRDHVAEVFRKAGAKKVTVLYGRTHAEVESKEFLDALKEATGIWFDGGRQWRFVDCYENTKAMPLMFDVLKRGGVIGGTSAGATIQGDYLCRGGVFHNFDIRYEGYERGLGFLKGVAIDQHFTQRKRQSEMTNLMKIYPQYLGIGLDEATAIVVKGSTADVIGRGKVFFYDASRKVEEGQPDYEALSAGGRYDLKARKVLVGEK